MTQTHIFTDSSAVFSPCRLYRYTLWRWWDRSKGQVQFVGLNPSTADEVEDDPTIRRCINFARDWGYGGLCMTNLFAFRATDPRKMKANHDPVGPQNDHYLEQIAIDADLVVAAWGVHGSFSARDEEVIELLQPHLHHLGLTKDGYPKHPLYLRKDTWPIEWDTIGEPADG